MGGCCAPEKRAGRHPSAAPPTVSEQHFRSPEQQERRAIHETSDQQQPKMSLRHCTVVAPTGGRAGAGRQPAEILLAVHVNNHSFFFCVFAIVLAVHADVSPLLRSIVSAPITFSNCGDESDVYKYDCCTDGDDTKEDVQTSAKYPPTRALFHGYATVSC